jgi:hypothetical protein
MKPMSDAHENRRLAGIENGKAEKLPAGEQVTFHLKNADESEENARSCDWRHSDLYPPK